MNNEQLKIPSFHLWIPNIFEFKGGIQVYSAILLEALQKLYPQSKYDVLLLHDRSYRAGFISSNKIRWHYCGRVPIALRYFVYTAQLVGWGLWQKPKLIIATHLNFTVVAYWLKKLIGIHYWTVAHGIEAWDIQRPALTRALHYADKILAVSNYTRDRLIAEQKLDPNKIAVLPNTFDASRFQIATKPKYLLEKYGLQAQQPVILTVARLAEAQRYKGYDQILQTLPQIRQTIPDVHYLIVGKGKDRPRIESLIEYLGLQDCVTLAGFVPDEQLCDYYNLCDVFAMPSKKEGFGIVYLEALACGKPVLAGNQDGAVDALCHGELGALVNPDNMDEITQTIIQILQGKYPNSLIYQPEELRKKVINIFGFESFKKTLSTYLFEQQISVDKTIE
ncbi:glycosyltransferase [Stanieria sp. NIES-3757]|nr:glycosyltransferase [Stanieria sp. NIES-3757]